ncbi:hypothetical protein RF11_01678 [Thelohanellus kitauei]|uniref:Tc1-like transposase DDE domain-containing protein n=1 Tax=Thelohanellus kitauei TaxID=669202 RepID=A0A0C2MJT2_THEKT|nr:hypothetical protein RF11_01678 [Thelohanellus kitauei]
MDNFRFHKVSAILDCFNRKGHEVLYLPPYSSFLNPIEEVFSKYKCCVKRRRPENETKLFKYMTEGLNTITPEDCDGYYRHIKSYVRRSLNNEIIQNKQFYLALFVFPFYFFMNFSSNTWKFKHCKSKKLNIHGFD